MGKYKIEFKKSAAKELYAIPRKDIYKIINRIKLLSVNPRPQDIIKLTNREDYRIRVGNYRIIYTLTDNILIITIIKIGHRKEVYR
jgi:mRNA interferase RelE/StbE